MDPVALQANRDLALAVYGALLNPTILLAQREPRQVGKDIVSEIEVQPQPTIGIQLIHHLVGERLRREGFQNVIAGPSRQPMMWRKACVTTTALRHAHVAMPLVSSPKFSIIITTR